MSITYRETLSGGRVLEGETPIGRFRMEWDAAGRKIAEAHEPLAHAPQVARTLSPEDRAKALARAAQCQGCEHSQGVSLQVEGREIYRVRCRLCGCGGLSLVKGACKAGKWPVEMAGKGSSTVV